MMRKDISDPFAAREQSRYDAPIGSRECILLLLRDSKKPLTVEQLAKRLHLDTDEQHIALERRLSAMERAGQLAVKQDKYLIPSYSQWLEGRVIAHRDGYGFLHVGAGQDDKYIPPLKMKALLADDTVLAYVYMTSRGEQTMIVNILKVAHSQLIGRLCVDARQAFVVPSHPSVYRDIKVSKNELAGAKNDHIVLVDIDLDAKLSGQLCGRVVNVLGKYFEPGIETVMAIHNYDIPDEWPASVQQAVRTLKDDIAPVEYDKRQDLRAKPLITIDGDDARDFDDAVYCEVRGDGGWRLIVAIADVSHYVIPDAPIDSEARNRGTSVYFPDYVVPMLPEKLSNDLCSLKPLVDRLCLVCDMQVAKSGAVDNYQFYPAVIHSHARMTYTQVAQLLAGDDILEAQYKDLLPHIDNLHSLYRALNAQRSKRGAIDFETTEVQIRLSKDKKIECILPAPRNIAHRIIEECMLAANVSAADFIEQHELNAMYRVHERPSQLKIEDIQAFLKEFGLTLKGGVEPQPSDYSDLLEATRSREDVHLIHTVLLRSMSQARYSPENIGHFGLAYASYTHFTSPIRRYPDLVLHRMIKQQLKGKKSIKTQDIHELAQHCSETERRADDATRDVIMWLKCEYMHDKIGDTFPGIISGVTHFGLFVELSDIYVDGLLHISELTNDYYYYDEIRHMLIGERTGQHYRLGDKIRVKVAHVNLDDKKIDFTLP